MLASSVEFKMGCVYIDFVYVSTYVRMCMYIYIYRSMEKEEQLA